MHSYIARKIAHLKRTGLVANNKTGFGLNGGAAPDWLVAEQEARAKKAEKDRYREFMRNRAA